MNNNSTARFIIIDDDPINNHICSKYIELAFAGSSTISFTNPQQGLDHIQSEYSVPKPSGTILLLDINMPILSGWEVLDKFKDLPDEIKKQFRIYILSSSVAWEDKNTAENHPLVSGFMEKPISIEQLQKLFPELEHLAFD